MAGGYAHLTLVVTLSQQEGLERLPGLDPRVKAALKFHRRFLEPGSVSPDYPYLCVASKEGEGWANVMHYWKTADFVRGAIAYLLAMDFRKHDSWKCIAWLFGYVSHLVFDLTIHPVVNLKVGEYATHKRQHRLCELHQDAYIFNKLGLGDITKGEFIRNCGIASCTDQKKGRGLDIGVKNLWQKALLDISTTNISLKNGLAIPEEQPDVDQWHAWFTKGMDLVAEEVVCVPVLSRYVIDKAGMCYPVLKNLNMQYIQELAIPDGRCLGYDKIFTCVQRNTRTVWTQLGEALATGDPERFSLPNGCVDTGRDETGGLIFWGEKNGTSAC